MNNRQKNQTYGLSLPYTGSLVMGLLACFLTGLILSGCFEKTTAGTSTGTENPEIAVVIDDGNTTGILGSLNLYRTSQNPLMDSEPVLSYGVNENSELALSRSDLTKVADDNNEFHFNLVLQSETGGFLEENFVYHSGSRVLVQNGDTLNNIQLEAVPLTELVVELEHPPAGYDQQESPLYLFIPGSPYFTHLNNRQFHLKNIPATDVPANVFMKNGNVYQIEGRIFPQTELQGATTAMLQENIDIHQSSALISHREVPIVIDTVTHKLRMSDFCDVKRHPHAIVLVPDSSIVAIENNDTSFTTFLRSDTWAGINTGDLISSKKLLFYSLKFGENWAEVLPIPQEERLNGYCHSDKPANEDVRIDSVYFYKANSLDIKLKVIFTHQALEYITHSVMNESGELEELWRDPPSFIPRCNEESLQIFTWDDADSTRIDSIWIVNGPGGSTGDDHYSTPGGEIHHR